MNALQRRVDAAQKTLDRYQGKEFQWGECDCLRIAAYTLRLLNHPVSLVKIGNYTTALGAKKVLLKNGFKTLEEAVSSKLFPIGAVSALPADIIGLPGDDDLLALGVYLGNGRVLGFAEGHSQATVLQPTVIPLAWRTPVKDL